MFKINDYVIHSSNGVCRVIDIGHLDISGIGKDKLYYTLEAVYKKSNLVYTPVDSNKVVMRKILSEDEAENLIDEIANIEILVAPNDKILDEMIRESMKNYDSREWVKIIKTLYLKRQERIEQGKKNTATNEKYFSMAQDYLYGELSIALNRPKDSIEDIITNRLEGTTLTILDK